MPRTESLIQVSDSVSLHTIISKPNTPTSLPTLLLLHFWGGSNRTWTPLVTHLADEVNTIAPSLRGWGESSKPSEPEVYRVGDYASDVSALIQHLETHEPDLLSPGLLLCGHSMGGKMAQVLPTKLENPEVIKGVVLLAPAPSGRFALPDDMREQQIHGYDNFDSAKWVIQNVLLGKPDNVDDEALVILANEVVKGAAEARAAWPSYGMAEDYGKAVVDGLAKFVQAGQKSRVLVIVGELDRVETPENVEARVSGVFSNANASVERMVLEGIGHLSPVEAPQRIAQAIISFLGAL